MQKAKIAGSMLILVAICMAGNAIATYLMMEQWPQFIDYIFFLGKIAVMVLVLASFEDFHEKHGLMGAFARAALLMAGLMVGLYVVLAFILAMLKMPDSPRSISRSLSLFRFTIIMVTATVIQKEIELYHRSEEG